MKNAQKVLPILILCFFNLKSFGQNTPSFSTNSGPVLFQQSPKVGSGTQIVLAACPTAVVNLTQSASHVILGANSITCSAAEAEIHADNGYWRSFYIENDLDISAIEVGIEIANAPSGSQPIKARLYKNTGAAFPNGTKTLLKEVDVNVPNQNLTILNIPITASITGATELLVEIFTPSGIAAGNSFFIGSNNLGETASSYIDAAGCGVPNPVTMASLGNPNVHVVMNIIGCEPNFSTPSRAALNLDGVNDFVQIPSSVGNFNTNDNFTVSAWLKIPSAKQADSASNDNDIIEKWSQSGAYPFVVRYFNHTGGANSGKINVARYDGTNNPKAFSSMALNDDSWHHMAFTKQGTALKLYIDGKLDQTFTDNTSASTTNSSALFVGRRGNSINHFRGEIDELRIRSVALTETEIKKDMFLKLSSITNVQGAFNFDNGLPNRNNTALSTVQNLTGTSHGTLNNFELIRSNSNFVPGIDKVYVNDDAAGANNGSSWLDAFTDLQDALIPAVSGNNIWVAAGTYKPTSTTDRNISFQIPDAVKVYGGFMGNESVYSGLDLRNFEVNEVTLSGDIGTPNDSLDNAYHVVITVLTSAETLMDGFTIKHGNANALNSQQGIPSYCGGGWYNYGKNSPLVGSNPSIKNCRFESNYAESFGGGLYNDGDNGKANPLILNCEFINNYANNTGGAMYTAGYQGTASPTISNCSFLGNSAFFVSALFFYGDGGDISAQIDNCTFNTSSFVHIGYDDGNLIKQPHFLNCTFYGASSAVLTTIFDSGQTPIDFTNCIFWNNGGVIVSDTSHVNINYSLVEDAAFTQGGNSGKHNISTDPYFKDAARGDLSLKPCSPTVDAGTNSGVTANDILGEPRIFGCIKADMGAYEFQGIYKNFALDLAGVSIDNDGVGSSSFFYGTPILASNKILKTGVKTIYKAPNAIEFNPGFTAGTSAVFETEIGVETCP